MKFCKDCKHFVLYNNSREESKCAHPDNLHPVDGTVYLSCVDARTIISYCGRNATKFESEEKEKEL